MLTKRSLLLIVLLWGVTTLLPVKSGLSWAEVGGIGPSGSAGSSSGPYVFNVIDDGDPIPALWRRVSPNGGPGIPLNPDGEINGDGPPAVLFNQASGLAMVAWARSSAAGFDVVLSVFQDGTWSAPQPLAAGPEDELDPFLFMETDGTVHLVYWVEGPTRRVMHMQAPPDLSTWSQPMQVSQPGEQACRPAGAFFNGVVKVAYEVHVFGIDQTPRQIVLARKEENGFVPEVMAMTNHAGDVRPQPHAHAGRFWIDWIDAEGEAAWIRMDFDGRWEPTRYEPFTGALEREFLVRRAIQLKASQ